MFNSGFHEINPYEPGGVLLRYLPKRSRLVITDNSNVLLIIERRSNGEQVAVNLLDRIASIFSQAKSYFSAFGKKMVIRKDDAQQMANILKEQATRLETMASTYRLLAATIASSKDNFVEISKGADKHIEKIIDNPFI